MAFYFGYDTDDLTQRQYHYFCILNKECKNKGTVNMFALHFLQYCVKMNMNRNQFNNYSGDCEYLFMYADKAEEAGINLREVYTVA